VRTAGELLELERGRLLHEAHDIGLMLGQYVALALETGATLAHVAAYLAEVRQVAFSLQSNKRRGVR
jgi:hypothetical protein